MSEYRIQKETLIGDNMPTYYLDVKTVGGWKNIKSGKNRDMILMMLEQERRREQQVNGEKFWMVIRRTGGSAPSVRHAHKEKAIGEAQRLARQSNEEYYILEAVGKVKPVQIPIEYTEL